MSYAVKEIFKTLQGEGGGRFAGPEALADAIEAAWGPDRERRFIVFTGGEPLLQLDEALLRTVRARGFESAVETNGTQDAPDGLDWVCVSPKAGAPLRLTAGDELKLVYPQDGIDPERFAGMDFRHFWIQPMDGPDRAANTEAATAYCMAHPRWRLGLQTHKLIGIP